jgi:hypothetical protein
MKRVGGLFDAMADRQTLGMAAWRAARMNGPGARGNTGPGGKLTLACRGSQRRTTSSGRGGA